ncbi:conserved exported hypothetical protein [Methylocella tundrae]|nr:conserved exported hypothetical protein [Methylocella tundrae]
MRRRAAIALIFLTFCWPAQADFALAPGTPTAAGPTSPAAAASPVSPSAPTTTSATASIGGRAGPKHAVRRTPHPGNPSVARGFGSQIPLAFAVRQIVPSRIKVLYGPGADQNALVDWQGGKRWSIVLAEAVRPLGLRIHVEARGVTIAQAKQSD